MTNPYDSRLALREREEIRRAAAEARLVFLDWLDETGTHWTHRVERGRTTLTFYMAPHVWTYPGVVVDHRLSSWFEAFGETHVVGSFARWRLVDIYVQRVWAPAAQRAPIRRRGRFRILAQH